MSGVLTGRAAIITGASQGLGMAITRAYVQAGANVLLCARDVQKLKETCVSIETSAGPNQIMAFQEADVSKPQDVERLVKVAFNLFPQVHILVNNAGIYGPKGAIEDLDWEEWVKTIEINLFGSILMCRALLPHFRSHHYGKIIQLSGGGATSPMPRITAYAASKAAVVRFAESLAEETREYGIDVNSIAPGALNTRLLDEVLEAGPEKVGKGFYDRALKQKATGGSPLERGSDLAVFLGGAASDGITGKLISAVWDPWETFPNRIKELLETDVYTLRRIVPKDRNLNWGT